MGRATKKGQKTEITLNDAGSSASENLSKKSDAQKARLYDILELIAAKSSSGGYVSNAEILDFVRAIAAPALSETLAQFVKWGYVEKVAKGKYRVAGSLSTTLFANTDYASSAMPLPREGSGRQQMYQSPP